MRSHHSIAESSSYRTFGSLTGRVRQKEKIVRSKSRLSDLRWSAKSSGASNGLGKVILPRSRPCSVAIVRKDDAACSSPILTSTLNSHACGN
jgi:hypothetical protein